MFALFNVLASKVSAVSTQIRRFSLWRYVEPFFEHILYPFYRTTSKSSFGKLWSSILLFTCLHYWLRLNKDIPETLQTMVQTMLVYVFVTKPVQMARDHLERKAGTDVKSGSASQAVSSEGQA